MGSADQSLTGTGNNQFNLETKQKIYNQGPHQLAQGLNSGTAAKFGLSSGFHSTKVRNQRFGVTTNNLNSNVAMGVPNLGLNTGNSPNYNMVGNYGSQFNSGANTVNNANFQHKQR